MSAEFPETKTIAIDPPIVLTIGPHKGVPFSELQLAHPEAGEMRVANGQMRGGANPENIYLRTEVLIAAVTKRLGAPWPREAIAKIPDGQFTEAENFLMGFQQRANRKAMQEDMAALAQAEADGPATSDT